MFIVNVSGKFDSYVYHVNERGDFLVWNPFEDRFEHVSASETSPLTRVTQSLPVNTMIHHHRTVGSRGTPPSPQLLEQPDLGPGYDVDIPGGKAPDIGCDIEEE